MVLTLLEIRGHNSVRKIVQVLLKKTELITIIVTNKPFEITCLANEVDVTSWDEPLGGKKLCQSLKKGLPADFEDGQTDLAREMGFRGI